ncbi:MAG: CapA family protein [Clostridia bacterium]|nr:CapA family protein [Clostridia bacterium]
MDEIKITILGDVCPTDDWRSKFDDGSVMKDVATLLRDSDLSIANLECPATDGNVPAKKCGPCLKAKPADVAVLKNAGVSLLSLGNNHIKDYTAEGVLDTIQCCEDLSLPYVGAGETIEKANSARIFSVKNRRIAVLAFAEKEFNGASKTEAGANLFDVFSSPEYISQVKKQCDILIVLYHGGIEHYRYPSPDLQKKCRLMIRSGADAVLCQHSHCIGTYEAYENGYILYGQGNGVYGFRKSQPAWNEGLLLTLTLTNNRLTVDYTLLKATQTGLMIASKEKLTDRMEQFERESARLKDENFIRESWREFCNKRKSLDLPLLLGKSRAFIKLNRLLGNRLVTWLVGRYSLLISMNLLRCDAWHEVLITQLEDEVYNGK